MENMNNEKIGIGCDIPTAKLEVSGSIKIPEISDMPFTISSDGSVGVRARHHGMIVMLPGASLDLKNLGVTLANTSEEPVHLIVEKGDKLALSLK